MPTARITLTQPQAPPAQQRIELASDWGAVSDDGERKLALVDFPLPGRKDGPRDFRVFLDLPLDARDETIRPGDVAAARGFLLQEVGRLRGKANFTSGSVAISRDPFRIRPPTLRIDVTCDDGTRVVGSARLTSDPETIRSFLRKFAADVAALRSQEPDASIAADDAGTPTTSRPTGDVAPPEASSANEAADASAAPEAADRPGVNE